MEVDEEDEEGSSGVILRNMCDREADDTTCASNDAL